MSKREAVPKHSLPPQKQILSYMGRFINCPYAPDTEASLIFFLKPILAPIFALLFLKEEIPLNMIVGIVCFLIGSLCAILPGILAQRRALKAQK